MGQKPQLDNESSSTTTTSRWVIGLVSAAAIVMGGVYSLLSDSEEQQTQTVAVSPGGALSTKRGTQQANPSTVAASVTALGRLEPKREIEERISRLKAELREETATQEVTIKVLEAELANAEREYTRYYKLHLDGVISTSEFESKVLIWQTARERLNEAKANLNKTQLTLQKQIVETQANLN